MGLGQSSLASSPCLIVEPMRAFPRGGFRIDTSKPRGLDVDDDLYLRLMDSIAPFARQLNQGFLTLLILWMAVIGLFVGLGASGVVGQIDEDRRPWWVIVVLVSIPCYLFAIIYVYEVNNRNCDGGIRQAIAELSYQFEGAGYDVQYRTRFTGMCKPKHAKSERVIVFVPAAAAITTAPAARQSAVGSTGASKPPKNAFASDDRMNNGNDLEMTMGGSVSLVDQLKQDGELYR